MTLGSHTLTTTEAIVISDNEMPEALRVSGKWRYVTFLNNGVRLELGLHSNGVSDFIESGIRRSGAKTKEDVLKALQKIADLITQRKSN